MTMYSGRDVWEGLKKTRTLMNRERQEWQQMSRSMATTIAAVPREIDAAWVYLSEVVIPSLDAAALEEAATRLALPHVTPRNVAALRERDAAENLARVESIAKEPLFTEREARRNAAQIRLVEVEEALEPLNESVKTLQAEPTFEELISFGYGTDAYPFKFWQTSYYRHWQAADAIVERHGKRLQVEDFAGVRNKHLGELDAIVPLEAVRTEQRGLLDRMQQLEQAHAQASHALATLNPRALAWTRGRVREHLGALAPDEMTKLLQLVPAWRVAGTRILGLLAKQAYLEEMRRQVIQPFDDEARAALIEVEARIAKMSRPKKWAERVDEETYQKRIGSRRLGKWSSRRVELHEARSSIERFDRYDRYDPTRDFLWWTVMTDGRHSMPFARRDDTAVFWGSDDDAQFAAADAGTRTRDHDGARERDFS